MTEIERCIEFLEKNGYTAINQDDEYITYEKNGALSIDLNKNEIVFVGGDGDWLCIPCNYYALIGACIHYHQIGVGYKI